MISTIYTTYTKRFFRRIAAPGLTFLALGLAGVLAHPHLSVAQQTASPQKPADAGTSAIVGRIEGVEIEVLVDGPATVVTPLQIACLFEYTEGDIYNSPPALPEELNGMVHLDKGLKGMITEIRSTGRFDGHALETLLITPPKKTIPAKSLLLIGLGDRKRFTPDLMIAVGKVAMREALRLNVASFSFASDLKDAGIDSPTGLVAGNVVKGAFDAYRSQNYMKSKGLTNHQPLNRVTMLAGPAFFTLASEGIKKTIGEF